MDRHLSYDDNPETYGTTPIQFFEAVGDTPPPGTKGTPRPTDRPEELPPDDASTGSFQVFEDEPKPLTGPETSEPGRDE